MFCFQVAAQVSATGSLLEVLSPESVRIDFTKSVSGQGFVDNEPARFGARYGGGEREIFGNVVYAPSDDSNGCVGFNETVTNAWAALGGNVIVLVDRGICYFVDKVQHVQNAGGHAAIIVDNKDEKGLPSMAGFHSRGDRINIPSVLIHKEDGKKFKDALKSGGTVTISMSWNLPHPDNRVEWEIWTSSYYSKNEIKKNFKPAVEAFGINTLFTPHYYHEQVLACKADNETSPGKCGGCTNSGKYCKFVPFELPFDGADVIKEDLTQLCIFKTLNGTNYEATYKWWDYVKMFDKGCAKKQNFTKACSEWCMKGCGIDIATVDKCVTDSGGVPLIGGKNTLLEAEYAKKVDLGSFYPYPVYVNNVPYRQALTCPIPLDRHTCGVFAMICASFADASLISACNTEAGCPIGTQRNECNDCSGLKVKDSCGLCLFKNATSFNRTCSGCDGIPNSNATVDSCGICNGPGPDICQKCYNRLEDPRRIVDGDTKQCEEAEDKAQASAAKAKDNSFPVYGVVLIVIGCVGIVAGGVYYFMKRREEAMRDDIDKLLAQYINLDNGQQPLN